MTVKGACPVCRGEYSVNQNGTLRRHFQIEQWPGVRVKRSCSGSGLPPLGPWLQHRSHSEAGAMSTSDGFGA
jgi:hypothetical protein